ncbi:Protein of unknown function DUF1376 [uncultured Caudovirales phage]|uniref:DUF1376 domain-containing protein n=1 Tax=uncultured Caudovirales phage TaxID=2100421 RepID=A0A6J5KKN2_9CAUD|nr:Protein of unknown function DUF1376 [uncultured Caudovirales phage]
MHYYQFNIKSYQTATLHLTNDEDLAYRRLMDFYYDTESHISAKPDKATALRVLSRRLRVATPELEIVLDEFFNFDGECWKNDYCDQVIADYHAFQNKQRTNGSKGGRGNKANANPNKPTALPKEPKPQPTINNKQETINHIKDITPDGVSDSVFQDFVKLRKGLKAPVTETAIKGLAKEAAKANLSLQAVMELCCQNGWRGFKAEWMDKKQTVGDKNRQVLSGLTRGLMGNGNANLLAG